MYLPSAIVVHTCCLHVRQVYVTRDMMHDVHTAYNVTSSPSLYALNEAYSAPDLHLILNLSESALGLNACAELNLSLEELSACDGTDVSSIVRHIEPLDIILAVFLGAFVIAIIIGNIFVILAVMLFREMRTLTNGLIVSLATADLLVAIIVLPLSLSIEITNHYWTLGAYVCDFYITSDVFFCTSSILNIVVIAVDRYWLITRNVRYTHNVRFPRRRVCLIMVFIAWTLSGVISCSPLFGWQQGHIKSEPGQCLISQDIIYTVFSTFGAFWFPLSVILLVYVKIFRIARQRALSRAKARAVHPSVQSTLMSEMNGKTGTTRCPRVSDNDSGSPQGSPSRQFPVNGDAQTSLSLPLRKSSSSSNTRERERDRDTRTSHNYRSRNRYRARTRNSARTLGLIIGGFVLCWLPFFLLATIMPFCHTCNPPGWIGSLVLWLGYSNSLINPAIYAIWDKNFRRSFRRLMHCDIRWTSIL